MPTFTPIWKDIEVDVTSATTGDYVDFTLGLGSATNIVYTGRAYRDGESKIILRLNDIVESLMQLPDIQKDHTASSDGVVHQGQTVVRLFVKAEGTSSIVKELLYSDQWDYEEGIDVAKTTIHAPIDGVADPRQIWWASNLSTSDIFHYFIGEKDYSIDGDFWYRGGSVAVNLKDNTLATIGTELKVDEEEGNPITTYVIGEPCRRWCIYYVNALSGVDSFLFRGAVKESDALTRTTIGRPYNTPNGKVVEAEVVKTYTANSGYLNDAESERLAKHLIGTPMALLHDLENNIIYPVQVTNGEVTHKTYKGEGGKLVNYEITLQVLTSYKRR